MVEVTFQRLDLERHPTCRYDYVRATDGDGTELMTKKCGIATIPSFTSRSNTVLVVFHTDGSVTKPGFQLSWREMVPGSGAGPSPDSGVLMSPNYPRNYPNNQHKIYTIPHRAGKRIRLTFVDFNLENHSSCGYDYLQVWNATLVVFILNRTEQFRIYELDSSD